MAGHYTSTAETPEEREIRKRKQIGKRIRTLAIIFVLCVGARFLIKNPPPPKTPDYSQYKVRYVPGMLDSIPASERSKLDPKVLASMQQADDAARNRHPLAGLNPLANRPYRAAEAPLASQKQSEIDRQFAYTYEKRREERIQQLEEQEVHNTDRTTVVEFATGGYIFAEEASKNSGICNIKFDRNMLAALPSTYVKNVRTNAAGWTPPLSKNQVLLKPARGIKIIVDRQVAPRITISTLPLQ